jgi:hypothetical protein
MRAGAARMEHAARLARYGVVSAVLAQLSDDQVGELVGTAAPLGAGIGGATSLLDIDGTRVFVKKIPLSHPELRQENLRSTANIFRLPVFYQYGLGSAGFGAWRELAAHLMTTSWVLGRQCPRFPLTYHWRMLPDSSPRRPAPAARAALERAVARWEGSPAVRERLLAIERSSACVAVFLEYFPQTLHEWLAGQISQGGDTADSACTMTERNLAAGTSFMSSRGLLHFDAHFNNILTDGQRLYFTDFGLAMCSAFELSGAEARFFRAHRSYDVSYVMTHLVKWLAPAQRGEAGSDPLMREYDGSKKPVCLPPSAEAIVARYAPIAVIASEFYRKLRADKATPYPAGEIERACAAAGRPADGHRLDASGDGAGRHGR